MARQDSRNGKPAKTGGSKSKSKPSVAANRLASTASAAPAAHTNGVAAPVPEGDGRARAGIRSYALLERDTMSLYMSFYKHTYGKSTLDRKTKEFIAIAAALATGCKNCLDGHLKKAIKHGASRAEISEVMAVTLGVAAATIVDRSDIAAANIQLDPETWTLREDPES